MKKYFKLILVILALIICLGLAACGEGGDFSEPSDSAQSERKAIHTVALDVDTKNVAECLSDLTDKNLALGGFVGNVSRDYTGDGEMYWANVNLRVPTEKMDELVAYIEGRYETTSKRETSSDVTSRYNAAAAKRKSLEEEKARLESMLDDLELSAADRISVIGEISRVDAELRSANESVALSEEDMRYSSVNVYIYQPASFWAGFIPFCIFVILPLGAAMISIWRATVKRNRAVRARREQEAKAAEAARMAQNNSQIH